MASLAGTNLTSSSLRDNLTAGQFLEQELKDSDFAVRLSLSVMVVNTFVQQYEIPSTPGCKSFAYVELISKEAVEYVLSKGGQRCIAGVNAHIYRLPQ